MKKKYVSKKTITRAVCMMLCLVLLCAPVAVPVSCAAAGEAPTLSIEKHNLTLNDAVHIKYAVTLSGNASPEDMGMLYWTEPQTEYVYGTQAYDESSEVYQMIDGERYEVFTFAHLSAKQMTDVIYARAYVVADGRYYYSNVSAYSVSEYAAERLGKVPGVEGTDDPAMIKLLCDMLAYGASAQLYFGYHTERLATDVLKEKAMYTVTFVDYDGTVLKTETVEEGTSATAPAAPTRSGYTFTGWDGNFSDVTADVTVSALYERITAPAIIVNSATASAGDTVTVTVDIANNPGIIGMTLRLRYSDSAMTLTSVKKGPALGEMTFTTPKDLRNGCRFPWDAEEVLPEDATNGTILTLTFKIADNATPGNYELVITYDNGAIIDNDMIPVAFTVINGTVTVE